MLRLKVRRIGKSLGVILPREMLRHLQVGEKQEVFAVEVPAGYVIAALDPKVKMQVKAGEAFMERYRDVLATLKG